MYLLLHIVLSSAWATDLLKAQQVQTLTNKILKKNQSKIDKISCPFGKRAWKGWYPNNIMRLF